MKGQPAPAFLPEKSCGQRSLVGYSRRGTVADSDVAEYTEHSYTRHVLTFTSACPIPKLRASDGKICYIYPCLHGVHHCVYVLVAQSCPILCNPMDCSLPGSSVQGILQTRMLELVGVAIPLSRGSSRPRDQTRRSYVFCTGHYLIAQSCLTLCDPIDCSSPSSSVHRILQARIPEWVAIPFSRGSS